MSKTSTMERAAKRAAMSVRMAPKREMLKKTIADPSAAAPVRAAARLALSKMPKDSSPVRVVSRCSVTGRSGSVFRNFGVCRHKAREMALRGEIPGMLKASW